MSWYALIADSIAVLHGAFVVWVVGGQLLILIGIARGWEWARHFWLRLAHLGSIAFVALEVSLYVDCVLFSWENHYRQLAGQEAIGGSFISGIVYLALGLGISQDTMNIASVLFALLVLATFVLAPPRRNAGRPTPAGATT